MATRMAGIVDELLSRFPHPRFPVEELRAYLNEFEDLPYEPEKTGWYTKSQGTAYFYRASETLARSLRLIFPVDDSSEEMQDLVKFMKSAKAKKLSASGIDREFGRETFLCGSWSISFYPQASGDQQRLSVEFTESWSGEEFLQAVVEFIDGRADREWAMKYRFAAPEDIWEVGQPGWEAPELADVWCGKDRVSLMSVHVDRVAMSGYRTKHWDRTLARYEKALGAATFTRDAAYWRRDRRYFILQQHNFSSTFQVHLIDDEEVPPPRIAFLAAPSLEYARPEETRVDSLPSRDAMNELFDAILDLPRYVTVDSFLEKIAHVSEIYATNPGDLGAQHVATWKNGAPIFAITGGSEYIYEIRVHITPREYDIPGAAEQLKYYYQPPVGSQQWHREISMGYYARYAIFSRAPLTPSANHNRAPASEVAAPETAATERLKADTLQHLADTIDTLSRLQQATPQHILRLLAQNDLLTDDALEMHPRTWRFPDWDYPWEEHDDAPLEHRRLGKLPVTALDIVCFNPERARDVRISFEMHNADFKKLERLVTERREREPVDGNGLDRPPRFYAGRVTISYRGRHKRSYDDLD